tara:strand:- start:1275 stop:1400 length:126 start_codon:yes stop_codon:yes gene_type:complete
MVNRDVNQEMKFNSPAVYSGILKQIMMRDDWKPMLENTFHG